MPFRRRRWVICVGVGLGLVWPSSAGAECLHAVVYVTRQGAPPVYVAGQNDPCLAPTGYSQEVFLPVDGGTGGLPTGAPNGFFVDLRVPVP